MLLRLHFFDLSFCISCYVVNQLRISTYFLVFYHFLCFFFLFSLSFVAIVSYCPYYSSSHASVKVREGISYWGPLGYEVLKSPKSSQSPDPRAASKRACIFKFRKKKESKNPLIQGENRWDMVIFSMCNTGGNSRKRKKITQSVPWGMKAVNQRFGGLDKGLYTLYFEVAAGLTFVGAIFIGQTGWLQWQWMRRSALKTSRSGCVWYWKTGL